MSYEITEVSIAGKNLIEDFLQHAGNSLKKFRYFNSRPVDSIQNHIVTLVVMKDKMPVGYGHLDKENDTVWLGTAVAETEKGKGVGKMIMDGLFEAAKKKGITKIKLSVDNDNLPAISLYSKYGFSLVKKENIISYYEALVK